ncbi:MAG: DNA methyltransferase [Desulfurellaceae bacterium]|nr:DNA methyltransferase [Desulfurellaceae bacterium]
MTQSKADRQTRRLFRNTSGQDELFEKSYEEELEARRGQPVECLGMTFENDEERREYFLEKLRQKLKDPEFRQIEGFPIGEDEDILRLSDPPYYTACPNPFLTEFTECHGRPYDPDEPYHRESFAVDVSEGKTDQLYRAHSYHTKVPHRAIVPSILHYTKPGDIVLDGFCGSGMTGVAAQWCGTAPLEFRQEIEQRWKEEGRELPEWGARRVILGDLSPAATFIAANYNLPFDVATFSEAAGHLLKEIDAEIGWMYETLHADEKTKGRINYTVWSEVFSCPECAGEIVFARDVPDKVTQRIEASFLCPGCGTVVNKRRLDRLYASEYDPGIGKIVKTPKRVPVLISYTVGKNKYEKELDSDDIELLRRITNLHRPTELPLDRMMHLPDDMERWGDEWRPGVAAFTHIHHLFLPRAGHALAALWKRATRDDNSRLRNTLLFFVEQAIWGMSVLTRYAPTHYSQVNRYMAGRIRMMSQHAECSPWYILTGKLKRLTDAFTPPPSTSTMCAVTNSDCARFLLEDNCIDYVFTDPPFGDNLAYGELNFIHESFLHVFTDRKFEAIISDTQKKTLFEYQRLMQRCFMEYHRVLKPGRWMTVVFHNSKNAVWNAIQEALLAAGFVVADVRTLDKKQGTFNQVGAIGAVKQDLVISVYKPNHGLEERFKLKAGTADGAWDFVRTHLRQLPVFVAKDGQAEVIAERQNYLLFDRMVAFHVRRDVTVPLSAAEFYAGLEQRFPPRDGMYFLPDQAAEYDKKRMTVKEILQLDFFVSDEATAIQWLKQQLTKKPQTFQDIHPQFLKEIGGWSKHEKLPELSEMLEQNFLRYDGNGEVPSQIHSYLSSNFKELRNRPKDDPTLKAKSKDRWYVPDPNKAGDLEKLRERALLKEFDEYLYSTQKKLKVFRLEAVRSGFKKAWQERDYATIIAVARKIPETILQEDQKLLMWFANATTRMGDDS